MMPHQNPKSKKTPSPHVGGTARLTATTRPWAACSSGPGGSGSRSSMPIPSMRSNEPPGTTASTVPGRTKSDTFLLRRLPAATTRARWPLRCQAQLPPGHPSPRLDHYCLCRTTTHSVPAVRTAAAPNGAFEPSSWTAFVFDQVRQLLARRDLLGAGQLAHIDRCVDAAMTERRRLADLSTRPE
jgi:hypothetical protein